MKSYNINKNYVFAGVFVVSLLSCAHQKDKVGSEDTYTLLVDLTQTLSDQSVFWPTVSIGFKIEDETKEDKNRSYFYSSHKITLSEHGGTHLDAPYHFNNAGLTTEKISLDRLVGEAVVIDISKKAEKIPNYGLSISDIMDFEKENGTIKPGRIILLRTDWSQYWPNTKEYLGDDRPGQVERLSFPSYSPEAMEFLIKKRKVKAVGVDCASIDVGSSQDFRAHRIAAENQVPALENLTNLAVLPAKGFKVWALPAKIKGGSGGPVRVVAQIR